jgi:PAT family beta-lactamase induction signal transducer AmpG
MFTSLYVVQGVGLAYFRNFQKPYLDNLGVLPDQIGLLTLILQLPFVLKVFIAMISDRINLFGQGHRKPYIVIGLVLAAFSFAAAGLVQPSAQLLMFSFFVVLGSFSVTVFDSATDGLAIDITPQDEAGKIQGVMVGGRAASFILLSLIFGRLVEHAGYSVIFLIVGITMLLPLIFIVQLKEPTARAIMHRFQWNAFGELGQTRFLQFALYAILYSIGSFGIDGLVTYALSESFQATESIIGSYGALRGIGAVIGAIAGGLIIDRLGRRPGALGAAVLISTLGLLFSLAPTTSVMIGIGLVWGTIWAFQETVFFALAMDLSDPRIAASMFAIMMGISNLGAAVGDGVATALSDDLGFSTVFALLAVVNLTTVPLLMILFEKRTGSGTRTSSIS